MLSPQQADTAGSLDAFFGLLREVLGLDDDGLGGKVTSSQQLVVALQSVEINLVLELTNYLLKNKKLFVIGNLSNTFF